MVLVPVNIGSLEYLGMSDLGGGDIIGNLSTTIMSGIITFPNYVCKGKKWNSIKGHRDLQGAWEGLVR